MLTAAQIERRRSGLGSSDIGAIAGVSPHASALDIYCLKTGLAESSPETPAQRAGRHLEAAVAAMYAEREAAEIAPARVAWPRSVDGTIQSPFHPWALATPDFAVVEDGAIARILEIKTAGSYRSHEWGEDGTDGIPLHYLAQVTWQMGVAGIGRCDLAALIGGQDLRVYRIAFDPELWAMLVDAGGHFWTRVLEQHPPEIDGSESARAYLHARYPRQRTPLRMASPEAERWATQLAKARADLEAAESAKTEAENRIKEAIAESEGLEGEGWRATWKAAATGGVDWKGVAESLGATPALIAQHTRPEPRKFLFKTTKDRT